jgi:hypothetical protein
MLKAEVIQMKLVVLTLFMATGQKHKKKLVGVMGILLPLHIKKVFN